MSDSEKFVTKIIKRPFIPFWDLIPSGVDLGTCIVVKGRVPRFANQFAFNFICGQEISAFAHNFADIALQFKPMFDEEGLLVHNSRVGGYWGPEERIRREFPFARLQWFEVKFVFTKSFIKIFIDGSDFALFIHRIPIQFIGIFSIEGDVEIDSVVFARDVVNNIVEQRLKSQMITNGVVRDDNNMKIVSETKVKQQIDHNLNVYTSSHSIVDNMVMSQKTIYNPPIPFCQPIFNSLKSGTTITINGQTMKSPKQFTIRLQWPPNSSPTPDVAISLTVDFELSEIIRKCRIDGQWLKEETIRQFFPFKGNYSHQYFELKLSVNENRFKISFNGIYFGEYVSRISDYSMSNMIEIEGDLQIIYVKFDASKVD